MEPDLIVAVVEVCAVLVAAVAVVRGARDHRESMELVAFTTLTSRHAEAVRQCGKARKNEPTERGRGRSVSRRGPAGRGTG